MLLRIKRTFSLQSGVSPRDRLHRVPGRRRAELDGAHRGGQGHLPPVPRQDQQHRRRRRRDRRQEEQPGTAGEGKQILVLSSIKLDFESIAELEASRKPSWRGPWFQC